MLRTLKITNYKTRREKVMANYAFIDKERTQKIYANDDNIMKYKSVRCYCKNLNFDTYNSLTPNWYYKVLR